MRPAANIPSSEMQEEILADWQSAQVMPCSLTLQPVCQPLQGRSLFSLSYLQTKFVETLVASNAHEPQRLLAQFAVLPNLSSFRSLPLCHCLSKQDVRGKGRSAPHSLRGLKIQWMSKGKAQGRDNRRRL